MNSLIALAVRILEILFFAGWVGACLVLLLSAVEDIRTVFEHEGEEEPSEH